MLKTIYVVVILMGCLNKAALFSSALSEEECEIVSRYCPKEGAVTPVTLMEAIVRLSVAKIHVEKNLAILRGPASARFEDNKHLLALGLSSWEGRLCLLEEEDKALTALKADLAILNRAYSILSSLQGS